MASIKLRKGAIIIGFITDIVISIVAGGIMGFTIVYMAGGVADEALTDSLPIKLAGMGISGLATIIGGFVAATRAGYRHLAHGGWVGGLGFLIGIPLSLLGYLFSSFTDSANLTDTLITIAMCVIGIGLGIAGGYFGALFQKDKVVPAPTA